MVQLTSKATQHIEHLRRENGKPGTTVVRLARNNGRLKLSFPAHAIQGDAVVASDGLDVYLDAGLRDALGDAVIDARTQDKRTWLVLRQRPV